MEISLKKNGNKIQIKTLEQMKDWRKVCFDFQNLVHKLNMYLEIDF